MRTALLSPLLICLFLLASPLGILAKTDASGDISAKDAAALIKNAGDELVILDVRTPAEFRDGHIANARNMNFFGANFEREAARLPKDRQILVYCRSGKRSAAAAEILKEAGLAKVLNLDGGLGAWEKADLPLEK